jgi:hypothetical protein
MSFGKSKGGMYRSQNGNDDLAMTSINLSPFFNSVQYLDLSIDTYENTSAEYRKEIEEKIFNVYRGTNSKSIYNFDELRRLNTSVSGEVGDSQVKNSVFDLESLDHMKKIKGKFFKS